MKLLNQAESETQVARSLLVSEFHFAAREQWPAISEIFRDSAPSHTEIDHPVWWVFFADGSATWTADARELGLLMAASSSTLDAFQRKQ